MNLMNLPARAIRNKNSDWSITLPSNGDPISYKNDTRAQCNVIPPTILKKFDHEPGPPSEDNIIRIQ